MIENNKAKFFTCKNDIAFKIIICNNDNKKYLLAILSTVFKREFKDVAILNPELIKRDLHVRRKMVDLLLKEENSTIIVELNAYKRNNFRNFAYLCSEVASKTKSGENYNINYQFFQVNLSYGMKTHKDAIEYFVQSKDQEKYIENFCVIEYDMDRLASYFKNNDQEKINEYKYLMMLNMNLDELAKLGKENELIMEYKKELEEVNNNDEYIPYMTAEEDEKKLRNTEIDLAMKEGLEQGLEQGLERGLEQGFEQGKQERNKELIKNLLKNGKNLKEISDILDIDEKEIKEILSSIEL